jgi:hypothetical protein
LSGGETIHSCKSSSAADAETMSYQAFGVTATTAAPHFGKRCPIGLPTRLADQPGKRAKLFPQQMLREASP